MISQYYIYNNLYLVQGIDSNLDWLVINYFYEPIGNNKD